MHLSRRTIMYIVIVIIVVLACALVPACTSGAPRERAVVPTTVYGGIISSPGLVFTAKHAPLRYSIYRGANRTKRVILTYDDCPTSELQFKKAITYASSHGIGLALFPIGDCVRSYAKQGFDLVGYARNRGIWVGNHSKSHPDTFPYLTQAQATRQIEGTVIADVGRPPYGAYRSKGRGISGAVKNAYANIRSHDRTGMRIWNWTVDTNDWQGKSREAIVKWTIMYSRAGGTVLMHMNHAGFNAWTIRHIRAGLAEKNLQLCRIWRGSDHLGEIEPTGVFFPSNIC